MVSAVDFFSDVYTLRKPTLKAANVRISVLVRNITKKSNGEKQPNLYLFKQKCGGFSLLFCETTSLFFAI